MSRYAFARKPKWILGHLIVLALVVGFVNAGLWQVRRLHERQQFNAHMVHNLDQPVTPIADVLPPGSTFAQVTDRLNRRVTATGHYLIDQEIIINAQASPDGNSVPGVWVVSPLQLDDGRVLLVNRGWLPSTGGVVKPPPDARPPSGPVRVQGLVSETQTKAEGASPETDKPYQTSFLRIDVARIQRQFSQKLVPAFLLRQAQTPADHGARVPQALYPPQLNNGPHLGYAMQWFGFTLVALIGYPLLLWFIARDREKGTGDDGGAPDPSDLPPGAFIDEDGIIDLTNVARPDAGAGVDGPEPVAVTPVTDHRP